MARDKKNKKNGSKVIVEPAPPTNRFGVVLQWGLKVVVSVMILYFAYGVGKRVSKAILANYKNRAVPEHKRLLIHQLSDISFYVVMVAGVFFALVNVGVQTASLVTVVGSLMVTIGLALQTTLSNIFSGVSVALMDNFRIGDKVRIYLPWVRDPIVGRVQDLNIAYVMLRQEQTGKILYIPNSTVAANVLVNMSRTEPVAPDDE